MSAFFEVDLFVCFFPPYFGFEYEQGQEYDDAVQILNQENYLHLRINTDISPQNQLEEHHGNILCTINKHVDRVVVGSVEPLIFKALGYLLLWKKSGNGQLLVSHLGTVYGK